MNSKEIRAMRGVEYDQVFPSGRVVRCYVAEVDPEIGLTCKAFEDNISTDHNKRNFKEGEEMTCINIKKVEHHTFEDVVKQLTEIKETGKFCVVFDVFSGIGGMASCGF